MANAAQVKEFAKRNGMKINSTGGIPVLSKTFPAGAMWIEVFESWGDAFNFISRARLAYADGVARSLPWDAPNHK